MKLHEIKPINEKQAEAHIDMRSVTSGKKKAVHKEMDKLLPRWKIKVDGSTDKGIVIRDKESDIEGFMRDIERNKILHHVIYVDILG